MTTSNDNAYKELDLPDKIHLTVATVVERDGLFLLVEETRDGVQVINQPAGHVEPGESVLDAAVRETLEETGWRVRLTGFIGFSHHLAVASGITYYRVSFVAETETFDAQAEIDADIDAVVWLSLKELEQRVDGLRSPMVLDCIHRYRRGEVVPMAVFLNTEGP